MRKFYGILFGLFTLFTSSVFAEQNQSTIQQLSQDWATAIASRNPDKIAALYDKNAFLYATFTNMLDTAPAIHDYFVNLVKHPDLQVEFTNQNIRLFGDFAAINSGLYVFSFKENDKVVKVPGRYTFVYYKTPQGWLIIDHHSSVMPEDQ